jgi:hypothetical protein
LLLPPSWSDLVYFLKPLLVCSAFYPVQAFYFSEAKSNQKFKQIFKINSLLKLFGVVTFLIFINLMNFEAFKSFVYVQSLLGLALIIMMKKDNYFKSIVWTNLNKILLGGYAVLLTYTLIN